MKIALTLVTLAAFIIIVGIASRVTAQTSSCITGGAVGASSPELAADCDTMLAFKDVLRGTADLNWSADTSIGSWDGVRTGGSPARVTVIRLQKRELDGSIPAGIGDLDKLTDIWLYTNDLTGPLPPELGNLSELNTLMLANNELSGQLPDELNNLSLDRLWLRGNNFTGCVPYNLSLVRDNDLDRVNLPLCGPPPSTPTVRDLVCEQLSFAVIDAYVALVTLPTENGDEALSGFNATEERIKARLGYIVSITDEEPLLQRLTWPLYTLYAIDSVPQDPFETITTGRQLNRLCLMDGYPEGFTGDLDILTEYGCSSYGMVRNEKPALGLFAGSYPPKCTPAGVNHNHDFDYAEKSHTHGGY